MSSYAFCKENTEFGKVEKINWRDDGSTLIEFLENVIFRYPVMIPDISNIYVLVAKNNFPIDHFNEEHRNIFKKNEKIVVGYIWLSKYYSNSNNSFIDYIDTRVPGMNIAKYMMQQYQSMEDKILLPLEITKDAHFYWRKYFESMFDVKSNRDLDKMIKHLNIKPDNICWDKLRKILS